MVSLRLVTLFPWNTFALGFPSTLVKYGKSKIHTNTLIIQKRRSTKIYVEFHENKNTLFGTHFRYYITFQSNVASVQWSIAHHELCYSSKIPWKFLAQPETMFLLSKSVTVELWASDRLTSRKLWLTYFRLTLILHLLIRIPLLPHFQALWFW